MMTKSQQWARKRNFLKAFLIGTRKQLKDGLTLCGEEKNKAKEIDRRIKGLLETWEVNSNKAKREYFEMKGWGI